MHSWKRNLALELAQTKLPKKVYDHGEIDHASEILELPRSYESIDAKILTPPPGKANDPGGVYYVKAKDGTPRKKLLYSDAKCTKMLRGAAVGTIAKRPVPHRVPREIRSSDGWTSRSTSRPAASSTPPPGEEGSQGG